MRSKALRVLSILPTAKLVAITPDIVRKLAGAESATFRSFVIRFVPKLPSGTLAGSQSAIEELLEHPDPDTRINALELFKHDERCPFDSWALLPDVRREKRVRHKAAIARRLDNPHPAVRRLALKVLQVLPIDNM